MPFFDHARRACVSAVTSVPGVCAAAAVLVRLAVLGQGWNANPTVARPMMDGHVFLTWGRDIAGGDLLGTSGLINGEPFFFNPLYAYLIAPLLAGADFEGINPLAEREAFFAALSTRIVLILVAQALLGGVTAALSAAAADRWFGRTAAWVAGLGIAFSTALVHLDQHVAISGLAAFLTAGAVYACAPDRDGETAARWGLRGPPAAGLWLGLGALARPIALLIVPCVALLFRQRSGRWRASVVVLLAFGACAVPSLARNWGVSGKPYVYTAAGGINAYLGNNPPARATRSMTAPPELFRFDPIDMHYTARATLTRRDGRVPSWDEVSAFFWSETRREVRENPGASLVHYANKARWFGSSVEVPSSASLVVDRRFQPVLWLAPVPSWLLVVLGLAGLALHARRLDVLLAPGAVVGAHLAVLTLVFPLSHYRSPALPALAVLAGGAVAWGIATWRAGARGRLAGVGLGTAALAMVCLAPPQPEEHVTVGELNLGLTYRDIGDLLAKDPATRDQAEHYWTRAQEQYREAMASQRRTSPEHPLLPAAISALAEIESRRGRPREAAELYLEYLAYRPTDWKSRVSMACELLRARAFAAAFDEAVRVMNEERQNREALPPATKLAAVAARYLGRPDAARLAEDAARLGAPVDRSCDPR
jgi:4-amino-4-deoxy-L-arabinose transferase-like glycosyltransferase